MGGHEVFGFVDLNEPDVGSPAHGVRDEESELGPEGLAQIEGALGNLDLEHTVVLRGKDHMSGLVEDDHEPCVHGRRGNGLREEVQEDIESHDRHKHPVVIDGHGAHDLHPAGEQVILHIREPDSSRLHRAVVPGSFVDGERYDLARFQDLGSRVVVGDDHDAVFQGNEARSQLARVGNHRNHHVCDVSHETYVVSVLDAVRVCPLFEEHLCGKHPFIGDIGLKELSLGIGLGGGDDLAYILCKHDHVFPHIGENTVGDLRLQPRGCLQGFPDYRLHCGGRDAVDGLQLFLAGLGQDLGNLVVLISAYGDE